MNLTLTLTLALILTLTLTLTLWPDSNAAQPPLHSILPLAVYSDHRCTLTLALTLTPTLTLTVTLTLTSTRTRTRTLTRYTLRSQGKELPWMKGVYRLWAVLKPFIKGLYYRVKNRLASSPQVRHLLLGKDVS